MHNRQSLIWHEHHSYFVITIDISCKYKKRKYKKNCHLCKARKIFLIIDSVQIFVTLTGCMMEKNSAIKVFVSQNDEVILQISVAAHDSCPDKKMKISVIFFIVALAVNFAKVRRSLLFIITSVQK